MPKIIGIRLVAKDKTGFIDWKGPLLVDELMIYETASIAEKLQIELEINRRNQAKRAIESLHGRGIHLDVLCTTKGQVRLLIVRANLNLNPLSLASSKFKTICLAIAGSWL